MGRAAARWRGSGRRTSGQEVGVTAVGVGSCWSRRPMSSGAGPWYLPRRVSPFCSSVRSSRVCTSASSSESV
eukprot:4223572-Prymnesium_polylepis.1